jgi:hypothetical protein
VKEGHWRGQVNPTPPNNVPLSSEYVDLYVSVATQRLSNNRELISVQVGLHAENREK